MTPAERDEVRRIADACLCHQDHMSECPCDRCKLASAVLRYVPPADATYRDLVVGLCLLAPAMPANSEWCLPTYSRTPTNASPW